jgi:hypothetical protein
MCGTITDVPCNSRSEREAPTSNYASARAHGSPAPPKEPLFFSDDRAYVARALGTDLANYMLTLVFYLLCGTVGSLASVFDRVFRADLFERFICMIEYADQGVPAASDSRP